jgi:hypothetical protein
MNAWNDDPLFDRIRALPRPVADPQLKERVRQLALATLEAEAMPPAGARQVVAAAVVAAGVLAYFGWAVAFVLIPSL